MSEEENNSCESRIEKHLKSRLADLRLLWKDYTGQLDEEEKKEFAENFGYESDGEGTAFNEYGLSFDYVEPGTFTDQKEGYFRYQISYGGPSEEFRFYVNPGYSVHRIEFWFLDWFDGAKRELEGEGYTLIEEIYNDFKDCGCCEAEYEKATEE